jgi:hypothetical protein
MALVRIDPLNEFVEIIEELTPLMKKISEAAREGNSRRHSRLIDEIPQEKWAQMHELWLIQHLQMIELGTIYISSMSTPSTDEVPDYFLIALKSEEDSFPFARKIYSLINTLRLKGVFTSSLSDIFEGINCYENYLQAIQEVESYMQYVKEISNEMEGLFGTKENSIES